MQCDEFETRLNEVLDQRRPDRFHQHSGGDLTTGFDHCLLRDHDLFATQVRCRHNHRIAKVDHASFTVAHETAVEDLVEDVQYIAMRFLHFIEQDHAVRTSAHGFGQHTTLAVTHISRW